MKTELNLEYEAYCDDCDNREQDGLPPRSFADFKAERDAEWKRYLSHSTTAPITPTEAPAHYPNVFTDL